MPPSRFPPSPTSGHSSADAEVLLSQEQLAWADIIFVMEEKHRVKLAKSFPRYLKGKRVICLDIPDDFDFMQPELVRLLETRAARFLRPARA